MSAAFREFWRRRGGVAAFERWRRGGPIPSLGVRVVAPHFVAGFVIDDRVYRCAPILRRDLMGKTEQEARAIIAAKGWRASIVGDPFIEDKKNPPAHKGPGDSFRARVGRQSGPRSGSFTARPS